MLKVIINWVYNEVLSSILVFKLPRIMVTLYLQYWEIIIVLLIIFYVMRPIYAGEIDKW